MAAPIPMDDCAEIDATAIPIKYANGTILASANVKMNAGLTIQYLWCNNGARKNSSAMVKKTTKTRLKRKMFVPSMVYL